MTRTVLALCAYLLVYDSVRTYDMLNTYSIPLKVERVGTQGWIHPHEQVVFNCCLPLACA